MRLRYGFAALTCFLAIGAAGCLEGQISPSLPLTFDTASVKPARPNDPNSNVNYQDGQMSTENVSLDHMLRLAFGLSTGANDLIVGEPAWAKSAGFDIKTTLDSNTRSKLSAMSSGEKELATHQMLKRLLEDRFGLQAHLETQPRSVLALVVVRQAIGLKAVLTCDEQKQTCPHEWRGLHNSNGHIEGRSATLAMLANVLATQPDVGGRTVLDETKLTGTYDYDLQYTPDDAEANVGPSLFAALKDQLGLKLDAVTLPVPVLVIEHVSQPLPD